MPESFKYDVFLSHSSKDKPVVRPLAERLRKDGLRIWFDEWALKPGDSIPSKIEEGLELSRVLVLCMSANAFGSDWAGLESQTFRFRDPINKERRFIPLRLDEALIRGSLAQFLHINWTSADRDQEYLKLLEACRQPVKHLIGTRKQLAEKIIKLKYKAATIWTYAFNQIGQWALTGSDDATVRVWDLRSKRCLHVLRGHTGRVLSIACGADQRRVLSASQDMTLRLWDLETGQFLREFEGHVGEVWSVAWSHDQLMAVSGGADYTVRLWEVNTGQCLRVFEGHARCVNSVQWSFDQKHILSASDDQTVRLWDVSTGQCLRVFEGHTDFVRHVAFSGNGRHIFSSGYDRTVRMWEVEAGRCLRVLEGHVEAILNIALSNDSRLLLSGSRDNSIRLWDVETGHCLRVLKGHSTDVRNVSWSADQRRAFSGDAKSGIRVWDMTEFAPAARNLDRELVGKSPVPDQLQYTSAKVLMVGDTGVGKSGLVQRLLHGQFVPTKSSHARQAHILESEVITEPSGIAIHRETMLWDLAGQPAYRSIHQLSMDDAALACVLLDARSETNPFEGAAYWSQVLDQARTNIKVKKILVASRIDVGGLPVSKDRIDEFARKNGFMRFIPTSAYTGEGCEELLEAIREGIPWNDLPKVTTTKILAAARDYVMKLKRENNDVH